MKPRIFIGSSSEKLEIAYAIQQNIEHDAQPTVWTQGIFQLSNSTLDSLLTPTSCESKNRLAKRERNKIDFK